MSRLSQVIAAIDNINLQDPRIEINNGEPTPKEYLYSLRMSDALERYEQNAGELLKIAVRRQHIKRWAIPRSDYPMNRKGYLAWRSKLKLMHSSLLKDLMLKFNYNAEEINGVINMVIKKKLKTDESTQKLEDIICLVFLQYYFEGFAKLHPTKKVLDILRKTWNKMSVNGRKQAMQLDLSDTSQKLINEALAGRN